MADTLDTYIKSPSPPKDPDSQYVYNEQQFSKLEGALRKHHDKILDVSETSQAQYENEVNVRASADQALVETIETLTAQFEASDNNTQGQIQNIQTALADAESSTASKLTTLEAKVDSGDATNLGLIREEAATRATSVGTLASKVSSLEASVKVGQAESRALVKQETQARADAVSSEASARTSLQSYVGWDGGSYSVNLTQSMNTKVSKTDGASYEWAVQGSIDGVPAGSIRLAGAKRLNPSTGVLETRNNLIIDANTQINGDLIVTGTISGARIGTNAAGNGVDTANLMDNSVSNSWYQSGSSGYTTKAISVTAGRKYVIFAVYTGGDSSSTAGTCNLDINYGYSVETFIQTMPVVFAGSGLVLNVSFGYSSGTGSFVNGIGGTLNYTLPSAVSVVGWTAPSTGTVTIYGKIYNSSLIYLSRPVNLYIVELKK